MPKYGFIGLGSQGAPMARRMIESGYEVVLWARRPESLEPFKDSGASYADSVESLGAQVTYCGICVVDDAGVREVCDQLIPAMAPGGQIVIHSTIHPDLCSELAQRAAERDLVLLDAPVSGGGEAAAQRTLTVMAGGDSAAFEAVRPVLECFSGMVVHLGDVGAGQKAKLVNNNLMVANLGLAHHALAAADSLGIDRDAFVELIKVSSGRSFSFEVRARMPEPKAFRHGADLLAKDVRLLGETMGEDTDYAAIRNASAAFLAAALEE